ncbi:hypothetical protein SARC_15931, partial [Sphaeroforma arctica JP610]
MSLSKLTGRRSSESALSPSLGGSQHFRTKIVLGNLRVVHRNKLELIRTHCQQSAVDLRCRINAAADVLQEVLTQ